MHYIRSIRRLIVLCAALFAIMSAAPRDAWSCGCEGRPSVLDVFERSEHVLVAKVTTASMSEEDNSMFGEYTTAMTVEKVYKGGLKSGQSIEFFLGSIRSSCDYIFRKKDVGEKFLLYFNDGSEDAHLYPETDPDGYHAYQCGRNSRLKDAAEDILYLDNLSSVRGKTRLSGRLTSGSESNPGFAGRRVLIRQGDKSWKLTTDSNGVYEIYDLPAGDYMIEAETPDKWRHSFVDSSSPNWKNADTNSKNREWKLAVTLVEGRHVSLSIVFAPDTAIQGRVLSLSGQPMERVLLRAIRINASKEGYAADRTNKNGEFNIRVDEPGEYVLLVNEYDEYSYNYYPGGIDRNKAEVFTITPGAFFDIEFRIPELEKTTISVTARHSDGKTAQGTYIKFTLMPENPGIMSSTLRSSNIQHKDGKYHISIPKGVAGKLVGEIYFYTADLRNCQEDENLPTGSFPTFTGFRSDEVFISGNEDGSKDIPMYFPEISNCE